MNQTINISLPKSLNTLARQQVQTGYYSSVSEVVRDALRKLFLTSSIPTIKMSKKAEKTFLQARKDHAEGKTTLLKNINDLDDLMK
jgi:putative addiction module CopG family antidote